MNGLSFGDPVLDFEIRMANDGVKRLKGVFRYRRRAVLSDGGRRGRPQKESFAPRAFAQRINDPNANIHLLVGHRFDKPLADRASGTLRIRDSDEGVNFEADLSPGIQETQHGRDALTLLDAGLATGVSPGFRLPPERAVPRDQAETIEEEPDRPERGENRAIIRTIRQALLFELSLVTVPAYPDTEVIARHMNFEISRFEHLKRWPL